MRGGWRHGWGEWDEDVRFAGGIGVAGRVRRAICAADLMHIHPLRIYYEDTDLAGVVYYANYLRFIERARTEWVRALGVDQVGLKAEGIVFAVRRVEADYLVPARFDDVVEVRTVVQGMTGARIILQQDIWRGEQRLFASVVTLVALTDTGAPTRLPKGIRDKLVA
jgi:acyl-CoA thioester hydrolase